MRTIAEAVQSGHVKTFLWCGGGMQQSAGCCCACGMLMQQQHFPAPSQHVQLLDTSCVAVCRSHGSTGGRQQRNDITDFGSDATASATR